MYSQCPECLTRFRVTAAALRAARGTVRCGRCGSAFDALQSLSDTASDDGALPVMTDDELLQAAARGSSALEHVQPDESAAMAGLDPEDGSEIVTEFHFSADDLEQVFVDARDWHRQYGAAFLSETSRPATADDAEVATGMSTERSTATESSAAIPAVLVHEPAAVEDITLEGERIVVDGLPPDLDDDLRGLEEIFGDLPGSKYPVLVEGTAARDGDRREGADEDEEVAAPAVPETPARAPDETAVATSAPSEPDEFPGAAKAPVFAPETAPEVDASVPSPIRPFRLRERSAVADEPADEERPEAFRAPRPALLWSVGSVVLALMLVAQLTDRYSQDLARDRTLGPVVRSIYARLGRPLSPNWDLGAFEVRQWSGGEPAPASGPGVMTVRASLRNGADFAQPLPLLRLDLDDRFGGTVARRDFEPTEYLAGPAQAPRMLAPGAQAQAELVLVEVPADAVGYRLDVCLRDVNLGLRCAQSSPDAR